MNNGLHALYGGTFDPIHYGHLEPAAALTREIGLEQVVFMPNNVPPHRPQPVASSQQRRDMVALAIASNTAFTLDERELARSTPSWTVETLEAWRQEHDPEQPLAFIIGQDSLLSLPQWHRWQTLLSLCHLLVLRRPGYPLTLADPQHQSWLQAHCTQDSQMLHNQPSGYVYLANTPLRDISATAIRERLATGQPVTDWLPDNVEHYIRRHRLYGVCE